MIIKYLIIFAVIIVFLLISFVFYAEVKQNIDKYRKSIDYDKNKFNSNKKNIGNHDKNINQNNNAINNSHSNMINRKKHVQKNSKKLNYKKNKSYQDKRSKKR